MRQLAKISGIITTSMVVTGILLKMRHFPGASLLVVVGSVFFILLFLTSLTFYRIQNAENKSEKTIYVFGLFAGWAFATSLLFSIQHWPQANVQFLVALVACGIFVVLYLVNLSNDTSGKKKAGIFDLLLFVTFGMLFLGRSFAIQSSIDTEKKIIEYDLAVAHGNELEKSNNDLMAQLVAPLIDSAQQDEVLKLEEETNSLLEFINWIKSEMIAHEMGFDIKDADTISLRSIGRHGLLDYDIPTHYLIGSDPGNVTGRSKELKQKLSTFENEFLKDRKNSGIETNDVFDNERERMISWEWETFYHKTLIEDLLTFQKLKTNILMREKEILEKIKNSIPK
jgi:hypothetical protein